MAKSKVAAENAAIEETAVVEGTTAKTYTQEELDAILAWNTMAIFLPRTFSHSFSVLYFAMLTPPSSISPCSTQPLVSSIPMKDFVNTLLPEPDSPTIASVSPS